MRQRLLWFAIIAGASFYLVAFLIGDDTPVGKAAHLTDVRTGISRAINVVATMAIGLGVINLFWVHGANILKRRKEWPFSIVVFATFGVVLAFLLWQYRIDARNLQREAAAKPILDAYRNAYQASDPLERDRRLAALTPEQLRLANEYYADRAAYQFQPRFFVLDNVNSPLVATVMALLGFYITCAAYRAFRIRSIEATVMMLSAALVILGSDPLGGWFSAQVNQLLGGQYVNLVYWADLDNRVLNSGMQRGLTFGISVAIIAVSLRILLGLERGLISVPQAEG